MSASLLEQLQRMNNAARLNLTLLGTPEVSFNGNPLALNHLKARALLYYLAASGGRHTRDHLAALLWSETASEEAHHSLRSSLYRLRQALQPADVEQVLVVEGDLLSLRPASCDCDVVEFRRYLSDGSEAGLEAAVRLYRGPFLQGFALPNALGFEEWVQEQDSQIARSCLEALERLRAAAESRTDWLAAERYLQQTLGLDPLAEDALQHLMRVYVQIGMITSAVRAYRRFRSRLKQDLNLEPSSETQVLLAEALRQQSFQLNPARSASQPSSRGLPPLPFVGREGLLQQLDAVTQQALAGDGAAVLLEGEGGIGKSRLLDELASQCIHATHPWMVLKGACTPFDDLRSQGPFLEALEQAGEADLGELLDISAGTVPDARGQFSWRVLELLQSLSKGAPVLLMIEDLQWSNSATLNLFGFLAMRMRHVPVVLIGTVQQADAIPALQRLITLERRRRQLTLLSLYPLSLPDVLALLRKVGLQSTSTQSLAEWLLARSSGNPFLLTEILAQMRSENILRSTEDDWQLDAIDWLRWRSSFNLPETAHDLVAWRLSNLSQPARRVLEILAVAGEPLSEEVLQEFPDLTVDSLTAVVDDLVRRGLIKEAAGNRLALPHHLLRETVLHRLSSLSRRRTYLQLAVALETYPSKPAAVELRQLALYSVAGEDVSRARRYGLQMLSRIPHEYSGSESIAFVQHLHDLLAPDASPAEMNRLAALLGLLHQSLGHAELAAQWHQQGLRWAEKAGDLPAECEAHYAMSELALMSNDYQTALATAAQGLTKVTSGTANAQSPAGTDALIGKGHRLMGAAFAMEGSDLDAAEEHLLAAIEIQRRLGQHEDLCAALFETGNIAAQRGRLQTALQYYEESSRVAEAGHIHYYLALARNNFAYHSLLLGRIQDAQRAVSEGLRVAETHDLMAALLHLYSTDGEIHLYLAQWEQAEQVFRRGLAIAEELGSLERQAGYRGGLAIAASGRNEYAAAIRYLEEALGLISDQGYWHLRTRLQLWLAEAMSHEGRLDAARELADKAVSTARSHGRALLLVQAECLQAAILAQSGNWSASCPLFAQALERASHLDLPLESARVQAAWGEAALRHSVGSAEGTQLIAAAQLTFTEHDARADLARLLALLP